MENKILRRKIIIREYDFNKVKTKALGHKDRYGTLYDRATFVPLTKDGLEKEYMIYLLKRDETSKTSPMDEWKPTDYPSTFLWHMRKRLYDEDYARWNIRFDDEGYILIRYNKITPETRLGWGTFELDY